MDGINPALAVAATAAQQNTGAPIQTAVQTLGERGGGYDDASYTGNSSSSPLSMDYYREKTREFQVTLNAVDAAYRAAVSALEIPGLDSETAQGLQASINEYLSRRVWLKGTAEAINMGASLINAAGGRMPVVSMPQTLGLLPALPLASIAAYGAVAAAVVWGREWILGVNFRLQRAQLLDEQQTPADRERLADQFAALDQSILQAQQAAALAEGSPFAGFASVVKWGAVAAIAFFAWRAFSSYRRENPRRVADDADED